VRNSIVIGRKLAIVALCSGAFLNAYAQTPTAPPAAATAPTAAPSVPPTATESEIMETLKKRAEAQIEAGRKAVLMTYPETKKGTQTDSYHGTSIADPYRWLEDDNAADTKAWVTAQNALTNKHLAGIANRETIRKNFTQLYNFEKYSLPYQEGGKYFWSKNDGLQQQAVVYTAPSLSAKPTVALDPNGFSKDGTVALSGMSVSRNGRYIAYGTSSGGSDWQQWQVRDLSTGKNLTDTLKWVKFSSAEWTADGKGFFYSRYDEPKAGAALTEGNFYQKLYYHKLNTPQSADVLVFENKDKKEWGFSASVTEDGNTLFINVWAGSGRKNGLFFAPLKNKGYDAANAPKFSAITTTFDAEYNLFGTNGSTAWIKTDKDAPKGRVIAIDFASQPVDTLLSRATTVIAEDKDALTGVSAVGGKIIAQYLNDAATLVRTHKLDGTMLSEVSLPGIGSANGFNGKFKASETFYSFTSLITPPTIYRYDVASGKSTIFKQPKTSFNSDEFETSRQFATSADGTKVPVFIGHKKGLKFDGQNPTLLYGYGGFNVAMTPTFRTTAATWMQMGGVYVLAVLRGGGEYGAAWHDAGTKANKQNVFNDFIAAAEALMATKYTSPKKLAINGGSNGGLLVGAVLNQRPELFGAAVPEVGVMDMLRFHKFTIGWAWVPDYGTADNATDFASLVKYSPLHTVKRGVTYPPTLIMTADHDDRVVPAHSFKYAAEMQAAATEFQRDWPPNLKTGPVLIRVEASAGHGAGTPTSKIIEERTDLLAFIANALGVK
jgi:prolyl oligopeptidase